MPPQNVSCAQCFLCLRFNEARKVENEWAVSYTSFSIHNTCTIGLRLDVFKAFLFSFWQ